MKYLTNCTTEEIRQVRNNRPNAKFIEEILPEWDSLNEWMIAKLKFLKLCYFWKVFKGEYEMISFVSYMQGYHPALWDKIVKASINAGHTLLSPKKETLPPPMFVGFNILDRQVIDLEILECHRVLGLGKFMDIKNRVFAAYGHDAPPFLISRLCFL